MRRAAQPDKGSASRVSDPFRIFLAHPHGVPQRPGGSRVRGIVQHKGKRVL